jgi:preprotein translocase subunit SecD
MLYISVRKALAIVLTALVVCLFAVPNFLPERIVDTWPTWAQTHVNLGLDLQGGSHLLLEVDSNSVRQEMAQGLLDDVRSALRDARIGYSSLAIHGAGVEVHLRDESQQQAALTKLRELSHPLSGLAGVGQSTLDVADDGDGLIRLAPTQAATTHRIRQAVTQSIQILERRVNALGTVDPAIESEGTDRIVVDVPGLQDPTRLKALIGKTAKLTFQMVDLSMSPEQAQQSGPPPNAEVLYDQQHQPYLVDKEVMVSGGDLLDAQPGFDQRTGQPIVSFRFNFSGSQRFAQVTRENVGRPFAIVLDDQVISAPVIREPITGGSGQISGSFTVQEANDLAVLLRAGALPAPLTIIEERTIGPGLGQDSIKQGETASVFGAVLVLTFMLATYGLFGLFADVAVMVNVGMILGILSLLNATLTLPGIAGIVLTVGIAVDSNVLIYERIREEIRNGRSTIGAIDAGFRRALATILDSNITTFIAAAVLFFIGSGPVRGFAVTLAVGIVTTIFSAFTLTRLIVASWVGWRRPRHVPI